MRKFNFRIIITAILVLAVGCGIGASSVSALSSDGESLLSGLIAAGSSLGIDIGGIISTSSTTMLSTSHSGNAQADLADFLSDIGFDYSETTIIDLTDYILNRQGTFEKWIHNNYGSDIDVPFSVRSMTNTEIVIFLMNNRLYPDQTIETTTKYIFSPDENADNTTMSSVSSDVTSTESATRFPEIQESEAASEDTEKYLNGDVDFDGRVTATDARLALRAGAGLEMLSDIASQAADVNGDGRITASDARSILRYSAKLSTGF